MGLEPNRPYWLARNPPASASPALLPQAQATIPSFLTRVLGNQLRSSCLQSEHWLTELTPRLLSVFVVLKSESQLQSCCCCWGGLRVFNPGAREGEANGSLRPAWSTEQVLEQPGNKPSLEKPINQSGSHTAQRSLELTVYKTEGPPGPRFYFPKSRFAVCTLSKDLTM